MEAAAALHVDRGRSGLARRAAAGADRASDGQLRVALAGPLGAALRRAARAQPHRRRRRSPTSALIAWGETTARLGQALRGFTHPNAHRVMPWDVQHALQRARHARATSAIRTRGPSSPACWTSSSAGRAGLAAPARAGRPHRPDRRQHADRRRRPDHRDHRLRRHEPHRADHRPRVGARLARRRARGRRALPDGAARARRLPAPRPAGGPGARGARRRLGGAQRDHDRHQLLARRAGAGGAGVRRALQRDVACRRSRRWRPPATTSAGSAHRARGGPTRRWRRAARRRSAPRSTRSSTPSRSRSPARRACGSPTPPAAPTSTPTTTSRASGTRHPRVHAAIARQSRADQHPHALPAPDRDRARRAADRDLPAGARHGDARQLGLGGQRPRVADRHRRHRQPRRAVHRLRLPRHHRGDGRALARGLARRRPGRAHIATWELLDASPFAPAIARLATRARRRDPRRPADQRRIADLDPAYVQELVRRTHAAGGLWIADEVQAGHGRTGEALWASSASASCRTSSRSASRWATAIPSPP